ncbi:phosphonoacetaldehyde reductase [Streptomyces varsoviensis]|uniref:phosphonoacetaldehyde reductase n=1 Tax=Streptomyces varsoviensis TaxID=67373 RepID=UPI000662492E|nr:phosphonoacetaldehyde reductase [Streptomyces varsoviensis]
MPTAPGPSRLPAAHDLLDRARRPYHLPVPAYVPTRVVFGEGAAAGLAETVRDRFGDRGLRRVLVLIGRRSAAKPWQEAAVDAGRRLGEAVVVENPRTNPTPESIQTVLAAARRHRADAVVAIGGGSVLDTGKTVALLAGGTRTVEEALRTGVPEARTTALAAVPTTAGSGAEATRTATVWDERAQRKRALDHPGLFPDLAVVDPLLTMSAPDAVWAGCGLDALSQAVEASWAVAATAESARFSLPAVRLAADGLDAVLADPAAPRARTLLSYASVFAGLAIAATRTTVPHAVSYPLTMRWGIPHGHACALTLGAVLCFNAAVTDRDCRDPRGAGHSRDALRAITAGLRAPTPAAARRRLDDLLRRLRLPDLRAYGHADCTDIVDDVVSYSRFDNNPRQMTRTQLAALLSAESARRPPGRHTP